MRIDIANYEVGQKYRRRGGTVKHINVLKSVYASPKKKIRPGP